MWAKIKKLWFYPGLFFSSIFEFWKYVCTLATGAGLGFSGMYIYTTMQATAVTVVWNAWILATGGFSFVLAIILGWSHLSKHWRVTHLHRRMEEEICDKRSTGEVPHRRETQAEEEQRCLPPPSQSFTLEKLKNVWEHINPDNHRADR